MDGKTLLQPYREVWQATGGDLDWHGLGQAITDALAQARAETVEACAKVAESSSRQNWNDPLVGQTGRLIADAIRAKVRP